MRPRVLYSSYQTGKLLPEYVRFTLRCLSKVAQVTLLTNERELAQSEKDFLAQEQIELFFTENRGFDFGMWRRFLEQENNAAINTSTDYVLINDSIVYFQNNFLKFFRYAQHSEAEAVSLTENDEIAYHLQSFFLYLKPNAFAVVKKFILETPEQNSFYDVVYRLEIPLTKILHQNHIKTESIFHTQTKIIFSYPKLIADGAGFVKRKLLQRRFTLHEQFHFIHHRAETALYGDYKKWIQSVCERNDSAPKGQSETEILPIEKLPSFSAPLIRRITDRLLCKSYGILLKFHRLAKQNQSFI